MMTDQEILRMARVRTYAKLGFYIHASIFVVVMLVLFAINSLVSSKPWSLYPLLGWGLGVAIHGIVALGVVGSGFKDRMLQAEIARIKSEEVTRV
jgi:2TM domain-containing protein